MGIFYFVGEANGQSPLGINFSFLISNLGGSHDYDSGSYLHFAK